MTGIADETDATVEAPLASRRGKSSLQKCLLGVLAGWFLTIPVFWYLEEHLGSRTRSRPTP